MASETERVEAKRQCVTERRMLTCVKWAGRSSDKRDKDKTRVWQHGGHWRSNTSSLGGAGKAVGLRRAGSGDSDHRKLS